MRSARHWTRGSCLALASIVALAATIVAPALAQTPPAEFRPLRPELETFVDYMVQTHGFDAHALHPVGVELRDESFLPILRKAGRRGRRREVKAAEQNQELGHLPRNSRRVRGP